MGKYDNIGGDRLRRDIVRLATLIRRLEQEGKLLDEIPRLLKILGDLRQKMFAYEIRSVEKLIPKDEAQSRELEESRRIVREALKREKEKLAEWETLWTPDADDEPIH